MALIPASTPTPTPVYYTRLSDFKVGMEVDNRFVGLCKVVLVSRENIRLNMSRDDRFGSYVNIRGWVTVEYVGCHSDNRPDKLYQRGDPILGVSETGEQHKYLFEPCFREPGFEDHSWPEPANHGAAFDAPRPGDICSHPSCTKQGVVGEHIDFRSGEPLCWDCYEELIND